MIRPSYRTAIIAEAFEAAFQQVSNGGAPPKP
jgi:hypothetical protein